MLPCYKKLNGNFTLLPKFVQVTSCYLYLVSFGDILLLIIGGNQSINQCVNAQVAGSLTSSYGGASHVV